MLYDQAFALLGYAAAAAALDARAEFERRALALRHAIECRFGTAEGAFRSHEAADSPFESNPHMHLLEACLAWSDIGSDRGWDEWAATSSSWPCDDSYARTAAPWENASRPDWQPAPGVAGRIIEPGHQFEWAWLMLRAESRHHGPLRSAALRLIAVGEHSGVHNRVAINALLDDFRVHDPNARFWPQTERLKAALLAAQLTGDEAYWEMAAAAAASLFPYLDTPVAGLWLDVQRPNGELVDAPAPASTFYHLVRSDHRARQGAGATPASLAASRGAGLSDSREGRLANARAAVSTVPLGRFVMLQTGGLAAAKS